MRESARAVVIGGGVGGCAILYWLVRLGWSDVVLVERADLTSGSTFHSAGLVGQLRSSLSLTRMMMESVELYRTLEAEVGLATGWREVGSLRLASSEERMAALEGNAYESRADRFPSTMLDAIHALEEGTVARAAFGDQVVDHYLNYARTEQGLFDRYVTDWERKRYFERT